MTKLYPISEIEFLNGYEIRFRKFWKFNRYKYYAAYVDGDLGFPQFLKSVFVLWDNNLLKNK